MAWWLAVVAGALMALGVDALLWRRGAQAGRRGWAKALVVATVIYVVFAARGGSEALLLEAAGVLVYLPFTLLGLRGGSRVLAAGWALHVAWDLLLHGAATPFVPALYPPLCLGFDLLAAGVLATRYHDAAGAGA